MVAGHGYELGAGGQPGKAATGDGVLVGGGGGDLVELGAAPGSSEGPAEMIGSLARRAGAASLAIALVAVLPRVGKRRQAGLAGAGSVPASRVVLRCQSRWLMGMLAKSAGVSRRLRRGFQAADVQVMARPAGRPGRCSGMFARPPAGIVHACLFPYLIGDHVPLAGFVVAACQPAAVQAWRAGLEIRREGSRG